MEEFKPYFVTLSEVQRKKAIEALIFASDESISQSNLLDILFEKDIYLKKLSDNNPNIKKPNSIEFEKLMFERFEIQENYIQKAVNEINDELYNTNRAFHIVEFAGGFQFATRNEYGEFVANLFKSRSRKRLSQASLETLAIIAYKQPVTKAGVELIRGVNSKEIVNSLQEKGFVKVLGRSDAIGKPLLFGTTEDFLKIFGLKNLNDLPKLRELEEIADLLKEDESEQEVLIKIDYDLTKNLKEESEIKENIGDKIDTDTDEK